MFYLIDAATKDVVEGGKVDHQRPPWLGGARELPISNLRVAISLKPKWMVNHGISLLICCTGKKSQSLGSLSVGWQVYLCTS